MPSPEAEARADKRVCLGRVTAAHGVRGAVRIRPYTAQPENIAAYGALQTEAGAPVRIQSLQIAKGGNVVARIAGIETREQAEALVGERLYVLRAALPPPDAEEWYHADLIGLAARMPDGEEWGWIAAIRDFGAGDLLELTRDGEGSEGGDGKKADKRSAMIPFDKENVAEVDIAAGYVLLSDMARRFEWQ